TQGPRGQAAARQGRHRPGPVRFTARQRQARRRGLPRRRGRRPGGAADRLRRGPGDALRVRPAHHRRDLPRGRDEMSGQNPEMSKMRGLMLVAGREIRVRGLSKANIISTIVTIAIVGVLAALPSIIGGEEGPTEVGLAGADTAAMEAQLDAMGGFEVTMYDDVDEAQQAVTDGDVEAVVAEGTLYSDDGVGNELRALLESAWQAASVQTGLSDAGLSDEQIQQALSVPPLESVSLSEEGGVGGPLDYFTGLVISIIMFMMLMTPVQYIAMGVVEEKSSRIVEILLT